MYDTHHADSAPLTIDHELRIKGMLEGMIGAAFESIRATVCGSAPEPATAEAALPRRADYDGPKTLDEAVTTAFLSKALGTTVSEVETRKDLIGGVLSFASMVTVKYAEGEGEGKPTQVVIKIPSAVDG